MSDQARERLRGLVAVVALLVCAVDELVTALVGVRPVVPRMARACRALVRSVREEISDAYRGGQAGVVDAEVIEGDLRRWL